MSIVTVLPVTERIIDELVKRLRNCRYVQEVVRLLKHPEEYTPKANQVVVISGQMARVPEMDCPSTSPAIAFRWTIDLHINVVQSERSAMPIETGMEVARADVIKAVTTPTAWWTMNSLALNADWGEPQPTYGTGFQSIRQPLNVLYRVKESDPYTVHL